jgi:acyl carrier protein
MGEVIMSTASLKDELRALIAEIAEIDAIPDDTHFKDLGIDSMMGVEIVAAIERQYQIKIPDSELQEISTLNKSYELVLSKLAPAKVAAVG